MIALALVLTATVALPQPPAARPLQPFLRPPAAQPCHDLDPGFVIFVAPPERRLGGRRPAWFVSGAPTPDRATVTKLSSPAPCLTALQHARLVQAPATR
jgi:hypothetical protein